MEARPLGVRHVALAAQDLDRALRFYCDILGFEAYHTGDSDWAMVSMAGTSVSLIRFDQSPGAPAGRSAHPAHFGITFSTPGEVDQYRELLARRGAGPLGAPKLHRDGSYGFYLKDTEGNSVECIFIPHLSSANPRLNSGNQGVIVFAHGSSDARWKKPFEELTSTLALHLPGVPMRLAFMEFASPTLDEAVAEIASSAPGLKRITVIPVFLASGGHMARDIPALVDAAGKRFKNLAFKTTGPLGENPEAREAFVSAIVAEFLKN